MPKTTACSACGKAVYRSPTSRPEITCRECRRATPHDCGTEAAYLDHLGRHEEPCDPCRQAAREARSSRGRPAVCEECGEPFLSKRNGHSSTGWTRYCSRPCADKAKCVHAGSYGVGRVARAIAGSRRRRLLVKGTWDGITDQEILERDHWMCWLCKRRIGKTYNYPHPRSASIDHVLPISLGGDDTAFNKKAAHLGCNTARGNGRPGEQMPLCFDATFVPRQRRKPRAKPCATCGEPLIKGQCKLHSAVHYSTCSACQHLFVHKKQDQIYCSKQCSRLVMYAKHDEKIQHQPAHQRGLKAKMMRESGMSLDEIADQLGYSGAPYAAAAIARAGGQRSSQRTQPYVRQPRVAS